MSRKPDVLSPLASELMQVAGELSRQLSLIEQEYHIPGNSRSFLKEAVRHLFNNPGKQLRPALMLYAAHLTSEIAETDWPALAQLGAAIELVHSASLIHDDIIDDSEYRRNQLSVGQQFGNSTAVLVGDILYSQFFAIITDLPLAGPERRRELFRLFCRTTKEMCFGEIWEERILESGKQPAFEDYIRILETKTAVLMAAACRAGAVYTGAPPETVDALGRFGLYFGIAYQLADDYIDGDSLLKNKLDILARADDYIARAETALKEIPVPAERRHWAGRLEDLCRFIRSYAVRTTG